MYNMLLYPLPLQRARGNVYRKKSLQNTHNHNNRRIRGQPSPGRQWWKKKWEYHLQYEFWSMIAPSSTINQIYTIHTPCDPKKKYEFPALNSSSNPDVSAFESIPSSDGSPIHGCWGSWPPPSQVLWVEALPPWAPEAALWAPRTPGDQGTLDPCHGGSPHDLGVPR